jgi:hypothetical protein
LGRAVDTLAEWGLKHFPGTRRANLPRDEQATG